MSWLGTLALLGLSLLTLGTLGKVLLAEYTYAADRVLLHLGSATWLTDLGLPVRARATLILGLWALPSGLVLLSLRRFSRHLASGEPLRPGLSSPFRLLGWAMLAAFGAVLLANLPLRFSFFPVFSFRWIWLLRPGLFLVVALPCFLLARVLDEATSLRTEQDLVI